MLPSALATAWAPRIFDFVAQWPACTCPCERFAAPLRVANASLGVTVGRYSFGVGLFHPSSMPVYPGAFGSFCGNRNVQGASAVGGGRVPRPLAEAKGPRPVAEAGAAGTMTEPGLRRHRVAERVDGRCPQAGAKSRAGPELVSVHTAAAVNFGPPVLSVARSGCRCLFMRTMTTCPVWACSTEP